MNNTHIHELDITGHGFGDKGANCLGRILHQNRTLTTIYYDDNNIGLVGLVNICEAISNNRRLKIMPLPFLDIPKIVTENPQDKAQLFSLLAKMERELTIRAN